MSTKPYIPFYTSDFLAGTGGLTGAVKGVYITMLCMIYESEAPLKQSWDTLARRSGVTLPAFKKAIDTLVDDGKIVIVDDGIWSEKCEKHLERRVHREISARSSAKKRWEKSEEKQGKADANAMRTVCYPEPEPDKKKINKRKRSSMKEGQVISEAQIEQSKKRGWTETQARAEFEKFVHHHLSKGTVSANWNSSWATWMMNAEKYGLTPGATSSNITALRKML